MRCGVISEKIMDHIINCTIRAFQVLVVNPVPVLSNRVRIFGVDVGGGKVLNIGNADSICGNDIGRWVIQNVCEPNYNICGIVRKGGSPYLCIQKYKSIVETITL